MVNHSSNKRRRSQQHKQQQPILTAAMMRAASTAMILLLALNSSVEAFSCPSSSTMMTMSSYKPPVKSSVSKIGSNRMKNKSSRSQQYAAASAYAPTTAATQSSGPSSFTDRMRGMLGADRRSRKSQEQRRRILPSNVQVVANLKAYKEIVGEESDRVVAVRFFAPWCRSCKAVEPLFYRMANQFPNVVFVDVPVTEQNTNLHQGLGVPSLPYGHIYHPNGGLVDESRMTKKHVSSFARKVQSYVQGRCKLQEVGDTSDPYFHSDKDEPRI